MATPFMKYLQKTFSGMIRGRDKKTPAQYLKDARYAFQNIADHWDNRMLLGDPLFDQWMEDARLAAKDGLAALDKLEKSGYETGKEHIVSSVPTVPTFIEMHVGASTEENDVLSWEVRYTVNVGESKMITSFQIDSAEELVEARLMDLAWSKLKGILAKDFSGDLEKTPRKFSSF